MSNIYLKVTIEKKWPTLNCDFKMFVVWALSHADNFFSQLKNQKSGSKTVFGYSIIIILKEIMML